MTRLSAQELYAQLYDVYVRDWPGELDFYKNVIAQHPLKAHGVLEIACGTGRVSRQLAQEGIDITGLDLSPELLGVAQTKSANLPNAHWVQGDMRTFDIGKTFGCILIPAHSFQFMTTPDDQARCLEQVKRHLAPGGLLVIHLDHQDLDWLGGMVGKSNPDYERGRILIHPTSNKKFRTAYAWTFERATHTATVNMTWEKIDDSDTVIETWPMEPMALHCVFRFEMEHLLRRAGFLIEAVYGDFHKGNLSESSSEMIWIARREEAG
jgi:SAM-dependent methyltransferase